MKFEVKTKAQSLMTLTNDFEAIYNAARDLLRIEIQAVAPQPLKLRLMGMQVNLMMLLVLLLLKTSNLTEYCFIQLMNFSTKAVLIFSLVLCYIS